MMRVMMYSHGGSLNRGCEAIVRSSSEIIKQSIKEAKIYLASGMPDTDAIIPRLDGIYDGSDSRIRKYSLNWLVASMKFKLSGDESYAYGKIHRNIIRHVRDMDIFLSIGGDNYCYGEQPGLYEVNRRIKQEGKKLVLWGCSIGEEDMSPAKLDDLRRFDLILARETLTYGMLLDKGLTRVRLCADPAFTMAKDELPLPDGWQAGNTLGLNFSPLVRQRNEGSVQAVERLIAHILQTTDMTIALTPHVIQEGNNDCDVLRPFHEKFKHTGRVLLLPDHLSATQYKGYIARMRFFIGARTHATIAAYSNCVPTMVLGYSVKSKGIAADIFGDERLVLGIGQLSDSGKLIAGFEEMAATEQQLRETLRQSMPKMRKMSHKAVDYLKDVTQRSL